jgi:hypothetical protein
MMPEDLISMIYKSKSPEIIIAPTEKCRHKCLFINPTEFLDYDFGQWSFKNMLNKPNARKLELKYNNDRLGFDLDCQR